MNQESITFEVRAEPQGPVLKVSHRIGVSDKVTAIDWYKRVDGRWMQSGVAALDQKYTRFLPAEWSHVPDALLGAMGVEK